MYIEPNTNIRLLSNVPLDSDYEHTLYWESALAQSTYFSSKTKHNVLDSQFQRVTTGVMKVGYKSDSLYDCNYMMFQNSSFGNKWFYAFIKNVEYINNVTSKIEFEIDVVQTWWFEAILEQSYVERNHVYHDKMFTHLQPEPTGDYDYVDTTIYETSTEAFNAVVLSKTTPTGDPPTSGFFGGVYTPLEVKTVNLSSEASVLSEYINSFYNSGGTENIVSIFQYPSYLGNGANPQPISTQTVHVFTDGMTVDGYSPRNNKLFSYPYMYMEANNHLGNAIQFQLENFNDENWETTGNVQFDLRGSIVPNPIMILYPKHYRGLENAFDYGITYDKFPQLPWINDAFQAYISQHSFGLPYSIGSDLLKAGVGIVGATVNPMFSVFSAGQAVSAVANIGSTIAKTMDMKRAPDSVHGMSSNDSLNIVTNNVKITIYRKEIKYQFAKMIDDFFTMFGYSVNRLEVPHRNNRENYTYVKTRNCSITGGLPSDDKKKLMSIYDKGITFWKNAENVGVYTVSNKPLGDVEVTI